MLVVSIKRRFLFKNFLLISSALGKYNVELYTFNKADPFNLSWVIVVHKKVLILCKALNDHSASHDITGRTMM